MQALATTTERVPEGLLLAQPVLDAHAQLLLPEGTPVTREILNNLQHRGIDTIFVNAPEELAQRNGKLDPATGTDGTAFVALVQACPAGRATQPIAAHDFEAPA